MGQVQSSTASAGRGRDKLNLFSCCLTPSDKQEAAAVAAHAAGRDPAADNCCAAARIPACPGTKDAKPTSSTDQKPAATPAEDAAAAQTGVLARCDSASSTAFLTWANQQSASRHMSVEQFVQQHCKSSCKLPLDLDAAEALDLADVLAAAAAGPPASMPDKPNGHSSAAGHFKGQQQQQQPEPFVPHDGWLHGPPKPACHEARVVAADGINAMRQTRDGEIEGMLRLLCYVFGVETATVALLTGEAIYITGACGALPVCVCPDRWGFCGWSFVNSHHELLVVEDMDQDARFSENFFVCDPNFSLKFYVAAPLISANGHRLGTLCIMGQQPRTFDAQRGQLLANLAEMLVRQLEAKWVQALQVSGSAPGLRRSLSCYSSCYLVLDLSANPWRVVHMNEPAREATGVDWGASYAELPNYAEGRRSSCAFEGLPITSLFDMSGASIIWAPSSSGSSSSWEFRLSGLLPAADALAALHNALAGSQQQQQQQLYGGASYSLSCRLAISDGLDDAQPFFIGVPAWLALSEDNTWGRNFFFARLEVQRADGTLQQLDFPAAGAGSAGEGVRGGGSNVMQQQQQLRSQRAFEGDSVEQLMTVTAEMFRQQKQAGAASCDGAVGSSNSNASSCSIAPLWLPRDIARPSTDSSSSSVAGSVPPSITSSTASSTPTASSVTSSTPSQAQPQQQLGSAGSVRSTSSSGAASSVTASGVAGSVVCRGLPVPGLVMGPLVGRGSYGRVYRGLLRGQPVAVKIIDDTASLRLAKTGEPLEVTLTRDLKHTGIMSTLGYTYSDAAAVPTTTTAHTAAATAAGVRPQRPGAAAAGVGGGRGRAALRPGSRVCWMLFEYCDKGVLGDGVLRGWFRTRPSPNSGAPHLRVIGLTALEIAVAMEYLHGQGILHGDLCGGNVMLSKSATSPHGFTAKVGDFGLARISSTAAAAGAAGANGAAAKHPVDQRLGGNEYGTITHMSPEVLLGGGAAFTPAADVYSWGVLLWEMLTGSRAYAGMAAPAVVCQVTVLKRGLAIPNNLPAAMDDLLRRALSPEPELRPSFAEIVKVLTQFVQQSRAVDWEQWQAAVEAAHAEERAAAAAAAAAREASPHGDAAAGCPASASCGK